MHTSYLIILFGGFREKEILKRCCIRVCVSQVEVREQHRAESKSVAALLFSRGGEKKFFDSCQISSFPLCVELKFKLTDGDCWF